MEIFASLEAEYDRLDSILAGLSEEDWNRPSGLAGWTNVDVLLHLAQTEESVVSTLTSAAAAAPGGQPMIHGVSVDEAMDRWVTAERAGPNTVYPRWQAAREASVRALREADPDRASAWASAPLRPAALATTRLAEHWAHALDIAEPLSIPYPDTARLRHIAWLGHRTLPYAFRLAGKEPAPIRAELTGPDGEIWQFGPSGADSVIAGSAGAFCRVGARRLAPENSGLTMTGPHAESALRLLRNYAA
ncbi:maleylpyruvate isomerase family mycothiol-dependent enzyme [Actinopolymorpha sp. B17G11]|uniref:maleylpyruvate isomerase family mycothiol-dependent enzyme n=1 Tax=Actinopolymorpha sp. B17G11 TaxID=3160861 RepID=UPI0032E48F05